MGRCISSTSTRPTRVATSTSWKPGHPHRNPRSTEPQRFDGRSNDSRPSLRGHTYQEEIVAVSTVRLTVAQALVRFLANQYSERDGNRQRLIPGCFGIFGHGNVAGVGQALLEAHVTKTADLPYYLARNEQGMVHASVGYAKTRNRLQALAGTASIGPGSANMLTGAALATTNRL